MLLLSQMQRVAEATIMFLPSQKAGSFNALPLQKAGPFLSCPSQKAGPYFMILSVKLHKRVLVKEQEIVMS